MLEVGKKYTARNWNTTLFVPVFVDERGALIDQYNGSLFQNRFWTMLPEGNRWDFEEYVPPKVKKSGWVNIVLIQSKQYNCRVSACAYRTKEDALKGRLSGEEYVDCILIEWEE